MTHLSDWNACPTAGEPPGADIHLWRIDLAPPPEEVARLTALLSADERRRAERFRFESHRRRYAVGRAVLRTLIGRYLRIAPDRVRFDYRAHGKPCLVGARLGQGLCFNLSNSAELALVAFGSDRELGVDLEAGRPVPDCRQLVGRFFAAAELEEFARVPADRQEEAFLLGWTRKEAFVKALGDGLSCPLDSFAVALTPGAPVRLMLPPEQAARPRPWVLYDLCPADGFLAALVAEGAEGRLIGCRDWRG